VRCGSAIGSAAWGGTDSGVVDGTGVCGFAPLGHELDSVGVADAVDRADRAGASRTFTLLVAFSPGDAGSARRAALGGAVFSTGAFAASPTTPSVSWTGCDVLAVGAGATGAGAAAVAETGAGTAFCRDAT
jgi:hypothetical protein